MEEQRQKLDRKIKEDEMRKQVEKEVHEKSMMEMKLTMKVWNGSFFFVHYRTLIKGKLIFQNLQFLLFAFCTRKENLPVISTTDKFFECI